MASTMELPRELAIFVFKWVAPLDFLRTVASVCREFSFEWYLEALFPCKVVVPDEVPSLNMAINRLSKAYSQGIVLVRPGTYAESVRVTRSCYILRLGKPGDVVIEAPGWESALVSAGLGGRHMPEFLGLQGFTFGDDACLDNITFRCRNELMRGRCVYIVSGQLCLLRCHVHGSILVSGCRTAPRFIECDVSGSRGCGVYLTDGCRASLRRAHVSANLGNGVLVDRQALPELVGNAISGNGACGIKVFCGTQGVIPHPHASLTFQNIICDNVFEGNTAEDVLFSPRFVDSDAEEVSDHVDEA